MLSFDTPPIEAPRKPSLLSHLWQPDLHPKEPIVVHRQHGDHASCLVVFVHGLTGTRYGTWDKFPIFLYADLPYSADIALYFYESGFYRRLFGSIDLPVEAAVLADQLRELTKEHGNIILLGHSMGGLLIKAAIKVLLDMNNIHTLNNIKAIFYGGAASGIHSHRFIWLSRLYVVYCL